MEKLHPEVLSSVLGSSSVMTRYRTGLGPTNNAGGGMPHEHGSGQRSVEEKTLEVLAELRRRGMIGPAGLSDFPLAAAQFANLRSGARMLPTVTAPMPPLRDTTRREVHRHGLRPGPPAPQPAVLGVGRFGIEFVDAAALRNTTLRRKL
jgi:hypothetical protein